jgi:SAM-dependent methyltransferase
MGEKLEGTGKRDIYPTPPWVAQALLESPLAPPAGVKVLEPCCGDGYLAQELARAGYEVEGVEVRSDAAERARARGLDVSFDNFLAHWRKYDHHRWIVTNPPWSIWERFLEVMVNQMSATYVALIIPWQCPCLAKGVGLFEGRLTGAIPLVGRPSYDNSGGAGMGESGIYVWDRRREPISLYARRKPRDGKSKPRGSAANRKSA